MSPLLSGGALFGKSSSQRGHFLLIATTCLTGWLCARVYPRDSKDYSRCSQMSVTLTLTRPLPMTPAPPSSGSCWPFQTSSRPWHPRSLCPGHTFFTCAPRSHLTLWSLHLCSFRLEHASLGYGGHSCLSLKTWLTLCLLPGSFPDLLSAFHAPPSGCSPRMFSCSSLLILLPAFSIFC